MDLLGFLINKYFLLVINGLNWLLISAYRLWIIIVNYHIVKTSGAHHFFAYTTSFRDLRNLGVVSCEVLNKLGLLLNFVLLVLNPVLSDKIWIKVRMRR